MPPFLVTKKCLDVAATLYSCSSSSFRSRSSSFSLITQFARALSTAAGKATPAANHPVLDSTSNAAITDPEAIHAALHARLTKLFEEETRRNLVVPPFKRALIYGERSAIRDQTGDYSFVQIYETVKRLAIQISNCCGSASQSRVAFICPNNVTYLITQWACWFSGQIAVPLNPKYPQDLLEYYIKDSDASLLIATPEFQSLAQPLSTKLDKKLLLVHHELIQMNKQQQGQNGQTGDEDVISYLDSRRENVLQLNDTLVLEGALNGEFYRDANAMILYTSGTTGKPKGVLLSHANLDAQFRALGHAWQIRAGDSVLHALPLNHVHGTINALNLPLAAGAKCVMLPKFDSSSVWSYLLNVNMTVKERVNMYMGVPTAYGLLIGEYDSVFGKNARMCDYVKTHCRNKIRLMISGSAPLPGTIYERWFDITGHRLLERYGMTEIGMALSNPLIQDTTRVRRQGCVGMPLPDVAVKIVDNETKQELILEGSATKGFWDQTPDASVFSGSHPHPKDSISGSLYVRGPSVFQGYWQRPEETRETFEQGWFRTGDTAEYSAKDSAVRILGRTSVDIIKTGGFKLSALELETVILEYPAVADVAVVGLPDETWGSRVVAVVKPRDQTAEEKELKTFQTAALLAWLEKKLPKHAIPKEVRLVNEIPRNAMGKINKKELTAKFMQQANESTDSKTQEEKVVK